MTSWGLKTLYFPSVGSRQGASYVDIVAVHGLDGDQLESWTDPQSGTLWLKDLLPFERLPSRVLAFGYKADASAFFGDDSANRILQHAHTLVAELEANRALSNAAERPIIFVCHGLGGILVKKALAYAATRTSNKVEHLYSIYISTYSIIFMGTPHSGVENAAWHVMAHMPRATNGNGVPSDLHKAMVKNSETLQSITDQFAPLAKQFHIFFFWEGIETSSGHYKGYVVKEDSAAPIWDNTERSALHATHFQMCKFANKTSTDFQTVLAALLRYARDAPGTIGPRWTSARRFLATQRSMEAAELIGFDAHNNNAPYICQSPTVIEGNGYRKVKNKYFYVPHNVSSIFTGRDIVTRMLRNKILESGENPSPHQQKRFVLYGLGGSGKTQFCLKFVQDNRESFWAIFWVDASSIANAERALSEIGRLGGLGETPDAGLYWLTSLEVPWLLVVDNADDPTVDYSRFFPAGERGHILVTSRNSDCKIHATIGYYEFGNMEEEDAITLLLKAAQHDGVNDVEVRDTARPIVKTLGYLALALIQAGASIRQGICSLEEYPALFATYRKQIMSDQLTQGTDNYQYTIYTTWEVSVRTIEALASERAVDAIQILHTLAFLHFEQVPAITFERAWNVLQRSGDVKKPKTPAARILEVILWFAILARLYNLFFDTPVGNMRPRLPNILCQKGPRWDVYRFRQAITLLGKFSLISTDNTKQNYSMHPMVHYWARERLSKDDQASWSKIATTTLAGSISSELEPSSQQYRRSLVPHIDACLQYEHSQATPECKSTDEDVARNVKFAAIYSECGMWTKARELQEGAMESKQQSLGAAHLETLEAMTALAWSYWNLSLIGKAVELQRRVVEISSRALGTRNPKTLKAMDNLAGTYWLCGKRHEARKLGEEAVEGLQQSLGPGHPDTLTAMENLGRTYMHLGRLEEGQSLQLKVLEARRKMLGPSHPDTLMAMANLGMTYHARGNLDDAERLLQAVVATRKRVLGYEHAYTLWAVNDLSKIYIDQGHAAEAEELLDNIWEVVVRTLGKKHIGASMTMMNFARAYNGQGKWAKGCSTLTDLINMQLETLGPQHPDTLAARSELARTYKYLDKLDEAEKLFLDVIADMTKTLSPEHAWTRKAIGSLSAIYISQGRLDEAETLDLRLRRPKVS